MDLTLLICTICWIMQTVQWILNWVLEKRNTASRHGQGGDDGTAVQMARLERIIDGEMTALKIENSKRIY